MIALFQSVLIAVFLTMSYRLVSIPLSDTARAVGVACLIAVIAMVRAKSINLEFLRQAKVIVLALAFGFAISLLLGRFGFLSLVTLVKFISVLVVASAAYGMQNRTLKLTVCLATCMLALQYVWLDLSPSSFARMGREIGVEDTFTVYGSALERTYFAYFQANVAGYSIFFLLASWIALYAQEPTSKPVFFLIGSLLTFFALATGGRGVTIIIFALLPILVLCKLMAVAQIPF